MRSRIVIGISLVVVMLLLAACAPKAAPAPAPQLPAAAPAPAKSAAPVAAAPVKPAWQEQWERTLAAAKLEGKVVLSSGAGGSATRIALADGFRKAYGIPVESMSAKGSETAQRIITERRAGLYNYDICMAGGTSLLNVLKPAGAFDSLEPALILPDVTDPELIKKTWWRGELPWLDKDRTVLSTALRLNYPIAINTNLVKEGEIKSYRDLLSPKWKGKIVLNDPLAGGAGTSFLLFADAVLGWDYLVELAKSAEPVVLRDQRLQLDWLTHGKVAVVIAPEQVTLLELSKVGAPVKGLVPAEGTWLVGAEGNITMLNKAPHPNAAKLFINHLLSKEGQKTLVVALGSQSMRLDVPVDHLPAEQIMQTGVKYFLKDDEKVILATPALQRKAKELLDPLMGK